MNNNILEYIEGQIQDAKVRLNENSVELQIKFSIPYGVVSWNAEIYSRENIIRLKNIFITVKEEELSNLVGKDIEIIIDKNSQLWGFVKCNENGVPIKDIPFYENISHPKTPTRNYREPFIF